MFSNKVAAWAILAAFLLSSVPTVTAGGDYDEWFWDITGDTTDEDGDGYNDTATVGYDPDTTCDCDVDIYVYITVYDNDTGDEVDSGSFEYTINNGEGDWFEEDWTPDYNGTFDFNITLYDDEGYLEDYADWYDVELWAMTGSTDETINVENGVFDEDEDQLMNDLGFYAHVKDDDEEDVNITVWKKNILGIWTFFNNGTTDEGGDLTFKNVTSGEYMWDASVSGEKLAGEGGYAVVDDTYTIGHVGIIEDWDGADDWDDFMVFVPEGNGSKDDAYVEVFDENGTMVDNGTTDDENWGDDHFFISDDLAQGNYTHYIYEEQGGDLLQNGSFYSYGSTSTNYDEWFEDWDYETEDTNGDFEDDTINISFDPDTECDCEVDINVMIEVFENETGDGVDWVFGEFTINGTADDWFSMNWTATDNGSYDFNVTLFDEDWNFEDQFRIEDVYLTNGGGGGGGQGDEDEWFYDWDYSTEDTNEDDEDDTIIIGYDPDTTCDCYVNITVYVDVYDNETGDWVDGIDAEHTIYDGEGDWFEQDWTAYENGSYDFNAVMYDEDWNFEDEFWIYDVYLSSDDGGGGGNGSDDDNGVGHLGVIDEFDDDDYVNDYLGGVLEGYDDSFKEDAYFEIYDEDGNLVDSGNPNYYGMLFVSSNLTEGWYYQNVYYEENDVILQEGPFYSYGDSTEFEVVNVDNIVVDEEDNEEYAVYDDVGFMAHQGSMDDENGVEGVGIEIYKYNEESGDWEYHAYLETNETGEAWLYNEACGEYQWDSTEDNEGGDYEVWAGCDDTGGGGDEDEWFGRHGDYETEDMRFVVGYDPDTTCDCEVDITVYVDVFDNETGDYVDWTYAEHTIYDEDGDWFEQEWTADEDGLYDFNVSLYDEDYNLEDWFWIYGVELAEAEQNAAPVIDALNVADGDEGEELSFSVSAHDDDDDNLTYSWDFGDGETASGENVKHTWADDGDYIVTVMVSDGEEEDSESATVSVTNVAPTLSVNGASSGQEAQARSFEADTSDVEADTVSVTWDFGDGETGSGENVSHTWADDGDYTVTVTASDEDGGETTETFNISISNRAPTLQVSASATSGDEGDSFAFSAVTSDVTDDTVSVTWDFGDGGSATGLAVTHTFTDDGTFVVEVIASDEDGGVTSEKLFITIANVAPTLTNLQLPSSVKQGEPVTVSIEATDPGDDEVTITWNWGDGTTDEGGTVTHTYDKPGTYTVTVCATDDDGGEDCQQATIPTELLQQAEDEGWLPGFGLLSALAMLGLLAIFRRR